MKVKQIGLRCFEFSLERRDKEAALTYIETHEAILNRYLLLLAGEYDEAIERDLQRRSLAHIWIKRDHTLFAKPVIEDAPSQPSIDKAPRTLVVRKPVRSGERIETEGDAVFFGRINSGAEVFTRGNCFLFAPLYGLCNAQGETAIVSEAGKGGLFIFRGEVFESGFFDRPKRFFVDNGITFSQDHI
ncbi:MAG: hypothetical protein LBP89_08340 [Helicobacteraceae bacterium]|jgi:septum site-determining protein MinC|nr:hypothetical protein [Helicobacteraceae bacterium]